MVTLTVNLDDDTANRLQQEAKQRGTTVDELLAAGAHLLLDGGAYDLSEEEEKVIEESDAEGERGEVISHDEMMKKLQALRG
jgi:predicted transcriptional regulator